LPDARPSEFAVPSEVFDAAVVGGGIGGCSAALALAQAGLQVILLEAGEPGHRRVCGEFLSPEAQGSLRRMGVLEEVLARGAQPMGSARIYTTARTGRPMVFPEPGLSLSRSALDKTLWAAAERAGAVVASGTRVTRLQRTENIDRTGPDRAIFGVTVRGGGRERHFGARWVIAAVGRNGLAALTRGLPTQQGDEIAGPDGGGPRFLGLKAHLRGVRKEPGEVAIFPFRGGYCGLAEIEDGLVNAALLIRYREADGAAPEQIWERARRENAPLRAATHGAAMEFDWVTTANLRFNQERPVERGVLCVGDAAGYIPPFAGDGMAMAMCAAEFAARVIADGAGNRFPEEDVTAQYAKLWRTEFRRRLRIANWLQPFFLEPPLTQAGLALANRAPGLVRLLVQGTRGTI